jgi:serine/threonine protein kinase
MSSSLPPEPITQVSIFEFELTGKLLGTGSYSEVTLCRRHRGGKLYALKTIEKQKAVQKKMVKYVQNERQVLSMLNHPYVLKLHHTSRDNTHVYMFFEYCKHGELWTWLQRFPDKILPRRLRQLWLAQIVLAVEYLHSQGIAHRDLKPENIFLSESLDVRVGDLGTSKRMAELEREHQEQEARLRAAVKKFEAMHPEGAAAAAGDASAGGDTISFDENRRKSILYDATRYVTYPRASP